VNKVSIFVSGEEVVVISNDCSMFSPDVSDGVGGMSGEPLKSISIIIRSSDDIYIYIYKDVCIFII